MNVYEGKNIRNVGIVGHGGSGKTSLVSAILFDTGATNRLGRVDDGNAPTDYDDDEIERKITIAATRTCHLLFLVVSMVTSPHPLLLRRAYSGSDHRKSAPQAVPLD